MRIEKALTLVIRVGATVCMAGLFSASAQSRQHLSFAASASQFKQAVAFDVSQPLRDLAAARKLTPVTAPDQEVEIRPERGAVANDKGYSGDKALQAGGLRPLGSLAIPSPSLTFEGLSNQDNFETFGFLVAPPDPIGDVGPNHYIEMINLVFAVYDKTGKRLLGPVDTGTLWANFPIPDCTDPSGDPVVLYDQFSDRWLLSQFTTRGPIFYNCVAVSASGDPTGAYFRYAFSAGEFFPDYPKYGVWKKSYILTSRDFGPNGEYGISVYALEKQKMINGNPKARAVHFFLDSAVVPLNLIGDGLLPADIDGTRLPPGTAPVPLVGTQDDDIPYGATFDAVNIWDMTAIWKQAPIASIAFRGSFPVDAFDSNFPCGVVPGSQPPNARDCLPEPGVTDGSRFLDILSYRQRPTWRLAYRNFGKYETMVTNQSVEALPDIAGVRWYEIRRSGTNYSIFQQGTYAPDDGVHRWMGSIAMDHQGNMALGYSVVNGLDVFPGIRYTGRMAADPAGQMTLGEGTIVNGSGVQVSTSSRWGDYTSMNVDPSDDCTLWYVNEYYQLSGIVGVNTVPFQTRIGAVKLPGCGE